MSHCRSFSMLMSVASSLLLPSCLGHYSVFSKSFFFCFIIPAELSSTRYTTTEAPVIAHHAKLGGLRLAPKGPAIQGGAPPIKEKKGRGVNWFTYRVAIV